MMPAPSYYEMAVWNQRLAAEEEARMRMVAQTAAVANQRAKRGLIPSAEALSAQERLKKRRKVVTTVLRCNQNKVASDFPLPRKVTGSEWKPVVHSLKMYQERWDKLSRAAEKVYDGEQGKGFVRHFFAKALEFNQFPPQVKVDALSSRDGEPGNRKRAGEPKNPAGKSESAR